MTITRREAVRRLTHATAGLILPGCQGFSEAHRSPPNVVLIISDDQAWGDFGFMGHPVIQTPHLDRLAAQSLTFSHGYVPASLCCPSLTTMITGLYPRQHGITGNEPPRPEGTTRDDPAYLKQVREMIRYIDNVPTLPQLLSRANYRSLQTGKWWLGKYQRGGFTHGMTHGDPVRGGRHGDVGLDIGRKTLQPIYDFIAEVGTDPFFIWYAPFLPHRPHNPPKRFLDKYRTRTDSIHLARYWAMCEWFDETCGAILSHLENRRLTENTLVIFITDNGWVQKADAQGYAYRSKRSPYDNGIRTPIMIRWPAKVAPRQLDHAVSSIDIAVTILTACGLAPTPSMRGINLLDTVAVQRRKAIFGDIYLHNAVDIQRPESSLTYRYCIADNRWKLILPHRENVLSRAKERVTGTIELYDLITDPHEKNNLAETNPELVRILRAQINAWWQETTPIQN